MTDKPFTQQDIYYMQLAIAEAKKGIYTTRPNPAVGCVLVKDGMVIGQGYHPKAGQPHAEIFALADAKAQGFDTKGATAYVTLEPCSHTGRTPPCADALIAADLERVVIASLDTNPKVAGNGVKKLQNSGIEVLVGVCDQQAAGLNLGFLKAMRTGLPYVRLKTASSLDGRTAMASGESKWITGSEAREDVQRLRARSAAIITGSGTIMADDPAMTVRSKQLGVDLKMIPKPKVIIVDRRGRLSALDNYQVLNHEDTLIWRDDLLSLLQTLVSQYACYDVLIEAGSELSGAFITEGLVDELIVYQAPCILGQDARPMFACQLDQLAQQHRFELHSVDKIGNDIRLIYQSLT
ncbi:bifunctional diaminohydroxyphosphoribosylaminopyrimidine deaminase/5-amino-6-(5-phosphoribosylamino)uracil reductase RibD [Moraxella catarrhalis]|uniref:Riboflavin biosynthesis protein RibD n=1 Tax=Moraxella catarrhalis TaxID=480 RepID=A0A198UQ14_MORCA|nr:bifunctional diaminohydroxyphosphoribosylaminopyrimidine deaminase/5-amino-6-(5-phosphoribosylamino)uracil reductase RibD [Moraxella catarrhalis]OAU96408.1 Diaminohydroxyphosphoribosylaminopyrimidine deaminase [Moraxella catarrhalis]OAU98364.1 Diaminohydroxyphosphoribosylaminopyrimidine deaminase [Moraxella catarrhalis]OAV03803.1 Diaminohydroxyphosphoribosylaminopyrimidine deaminase [Moraxella catarrhalis]